MKPILNWHLDAVLKEGVHSIRAKQPYVVLMVKLREREYKRSNEVIFSYIVYIPATAAIRIGYKNKVPMVELYRFSVRNAPCSHSDSGTAIFSVKRSSLVVRACI